MNRLEFGFLSVFGLGRIIAMILSMIVARKLSLPNYVDFQKIQMWLAFLPYLHFGMMNGLQILYPNISAEERVLIKGTYFNFSLFFQVVISVFLSLFLLREVDLSLELIGFVFTFSIFSKVIEVCSNYLQLEGRFNHQLMIRILSEFVSPLFVLMVFWLQPSIETFYSMNFLFAAISGVFAIWTSKWSTKLSLKSLKILMKTGAPLYVIWLFDFFLRSADRYLGSFTLKENQFAAFAFVQTISLACWSAAMTAFIPSLQKFIGEAAILSSDISVSANELRKKLFISGVVFCVGGFGLYLLVTRFYITKFANKEVLLLLELGVSFVLIINSMNIYILSARGGQSFMIKAQLKCLVLIGVGFLAATYAETGPEYLAGTSLLSCFLYFLILRKKVGHI